MYVVLKVYRFHSSLNLSWISDRETAKKNSNIESLLINLSWFRKNDQEGEEKERKHHLQSGQKIISLYGLSLGEHW
jgi:hypothetical protein